MNFVGVVCVGFFRFGETMIASGLFVPFLVRWVCACAVSRETCFVISIFLAERGTTYEGVVLPLEVHDNMRCFTEQERGMQA